MSPGSCTCLLCRVESHLLAELSNGLDGTHSFVLAASPRLQQFSSLPALLDHLRSMQAAPRSDELYQALFTARESYRQIVENFMVLAFLPMLHHTVRRVAKHQAALSTDDIAQQAITFFLEFLRSEQLQARTSYFAFAISRAVKRQVFEWAIREGEQNGPLNPETPFLNLLTIEESFERHALLRHFLHRCLTKGLLADEELDLLIQFKLDGNSPEEDAENNGTSSNATRQKLKRLLAKLRRIAR
jgi:hypothetical protein